MTHQTAAARMGRLCRGLAAVHIDDALIIAGGPRQLRFTGAAADRLARLIAASQAAETLDDAATAAEVDPEEAHILWTELRENDVLESRSADDLEPPDPDVAGFAAAFGREFADIRASEAASALSRARVGIRCDDGHLARALQDDLRAVGIGAVEVLAGNASSWCQTAGDFDLLLALDDPGTTWLSDAAEAGRAHDVPVLRLARTPHHVEVGPTVYGDSMACLSCFRADYPAISDTESAEAAPAAVYASAADDLLAALAGAEVVALTAQLGRAISLRGMVRTNLSSYSTERFVVTRHAGRSCHQAPRGGGDASFIAAYEEGMAAVPRRLTGSRPTSNTYIRHLVDLQKERMWLPSYYPRRPIHDRALAEIVRCVAGRRPASPGTAVPRRWTPSAGNMASSALYVITPEAGRAAVPYYYDDVEGELVQIPADEGDVEAAFGSVEGLPADREGAYMVLVGSVGRLRRKYRDRAFRLAHLDAGCCCTQLALVATDQGKDTAFATSWGSEIAALLQLRGSADVVTAIAKVMTVG